jgi:hypothetical protein
MERVLADAQSYIPVIWECPSRVDIIFGSAVRHEPSATGSAILGWKGFDLFDFQKTGFESQLDEIVVPIFDVMDEKLNDWQKQVDLEYKGAMSKAENESYEINARGEAAYRETAIGDQRQLLGAACLGFVATALKDCLSGMARYFNEAHPAGDDYNGKSWLQKRQTEYRDRFGIDFGDSPVKIESLEELILARNAGLHWDGSALDEYSRRVKSPKFIKDGLLTVERDDFLAVVLDAKAFIAWVHAELKKLRIKAPKHQ